MPALTFLQDGGLYREHDVGAASVIERVYLL